MRTSFAAACAAALLALSCSGAGPATPRPESVEPSSARSAAATRVVIRGDGFVARASERQSGGGATLDTRHRAWLADAELQDVAWVDEHTLEATVPAGLPAGAKRLVVENPFGRRGALDQAFLVIASQAAALQATVSAGAASAVAGQAVEVTFTVRNVGTGPAEVTAVTPAAAGVPAACTAASPAPPQVVGAGEDRAFTWRCTPSQAGTLALGGAAAGVDQASGDRLAASPEAPAEVTVLAAGALAATLAAAGDPSAVVIGQPISLTLTVRDTGDAAVDVARVEPTVAPAGAAACGPPSPAPPRTVPGLGAIDFTWTCTAAQAGALTLGATVGGSDAITGAPLEAVAEGIALTAQLPAALAAVIGASRSAVSVGQAVTATFTVTNGGAATANLTAVTPSATGTAPATCGAPTPAPTPVPPGESRVFTWTCTPSARGSLVLSGTVTGADAISGAPLSATPAAPASVTVQTPAALTAGLTATRAVADTGQEVGVTLTLTSSGEAPADVSAVTPAVLPAGTATCSAASPALPQRIAGGGALQLSWRCSASAPGSYSLRATVQAADANSGAALAPAPSPVALTVQAPAALRATVTALPASVSVGAPVGVSFTVTNDGGAAASVTAVTPSATGAAATCGAPSPAPPRTLAGGASLTFTWSCTATSPGSLALSGTATGADANTGATVAASPATPAAVTVLAPGALEATSFTADRAVADTGQAVGVGLTLSNRGGTAVTVTSVAPAVAPAAGATCTAASPAPPRTIAAGASLGFTWTCTATTAGSYALSASAAGVDAGTSAPVSASAGPRALLAQVPASLRAALTPARTVADTGQAVGLTLAVHNDGGADALVSAVVPQAPGTAGAACGAVSPPPPVTLAGGADATFTWSCTGSAPGSATLGAAVSAADANDGRDVSPAVAGAGLTVQSPAALGAALSTGGLDTAILGEPVAVTLTVTNLGGATAVLASVAPVLGGTAAATCTGPVPSPPPALAGFASVDFTWSCTPTSTGTLVLDATVSGADANTGAPLQVTAAPGASLTVISGAALQVTFGAGRTTADVGQAVPVTLTLANAGGTAAEVASVAPALSPAATPGCGPPAPAPPLTIAAGASVAFAWTCAADAAGAYALQATVAATDAWSGAPLPAAPTPIPVTIQTPAALSLAALQASRATANVGQPVTITLPLVNTGGGAALVSAVTPSPADRCGAPTPAPPQTLAGHAGLSFTWTCAGASAGPLALGATVAASAVNTGADLGPAVAGVEVMVQAPAALTATLTPAPASVPAGTATTVTLQLTDAGGAAAHVTAVAPSISPAGTASCSPPSEVSPLPPIDVAGGASVAFTWTCTPRTAHTYTLGAAVTAADANTGAALTVTVPTAQLVATTAQAAPASGEVLLVAVDPLGDGTSDALLGALDGAAWVGPGLDGRTVAWLDPAGALAPSLSLDGGPVGAPGASDPALDAPTALAAADPLGEASPAADGVAGVTALAEVEGILYAGGAGGILRAGAGGAGGDGPAWQDATPSDPAWRARTPVAPPAAAAGRLALRDRAVPAVVPFGRCGAGPCVLAGRNVAGAAGQPAVVPQLWRCSPAARPGACAPGDWALAAGDPGGDAALSQVAGPSSGALTVLAATPRWLYVGLDAADGARLYRAERDPLRRADLRGRGGCPAGGPGCEGLGGPGLGDPAATRLLDARVLTVAGATSLWIVAGDGVGPVRVYRVVE